MSLEKVLFALKVEDEWPPVGAEGVWCEKVNENYKLVNPPFFIPNLAYGDVFKAEPDKENEQVFEFEVVEESGHSVIWVMNNLDIDTSEFIEALIKLGCSVESLEQFSLMTIDVPPDTDLEILDSALDLFNAKGLEYAFPVWRLGE